MKTINIITSGFLDENTGEIQIGGVQTYIYNLSLLIKEMDCSVTVFQFSNCIVDERIFEYDKIICHIVPSYSNQATFNHIFEHNNDSNTIFIIATEQMDIKSQACNVIAIQHGVAFDIPGYYIKGFWGVTKSFQFVNKLLRCLKNVARMNMVKNTVCVDYNYVNWFRTIGTLRHDKKVWVIPNFSCDKIAEAEFLEKNKAPHDVIKIVFARRLVEHRGTIMFSHVIDRLIKKGYKIDVTIAGDGPCKNDVISLLGNNENVHFVSYNNKDSIKFHSNFDIAVVPTIYSEGTSLSLCEAMSAGCFPVSTYVGGLSNLLIDHYNGLLCSPDEDSVYSSVEEAILMEDSTFRLIQSQAYHSAIQAFGISLWKDKWKTVINTVFELNHSYCD